MFGEAYYWTVILNFNVETNLSGENFISKVQNPRRVWNRKIWRHIFWMYSNLSRVHFRLVIFWRYGKSSPQRESASRSCDAESILEEASKGQFFKCWVDIDSSFYLVLFCRSACRSISSKRQVQLQKRERWLINYLLSTTSGTAHCLTLELLKRCTWSSDHQLEKPRRKILKNGTRKTRREIWSKELFLLRTSFLSLAAIW